jgi:toxin ParE1/3/4
MPKVTFRPRAWEDVQESAAYLAAEAGAATADRFLDAIIEWTAKVAGMPRMGAPCNFSHAELKDLRRFPMHEFENWLIFYRPTETGIEVLRVLHGARDITSILDDSA